VSGDAIPGVVGFAARDKEGTGAILRRGGAMLVFPQTAAASTLIDVPQAREL
jgi:hypothetical protein